MKSKIVTFFIHLVAWLVFFSLPLIFRPRPVIESGAIPPDMFNLFLRLSFFDLLLVGVFYSNAYYFVPRFLFRKKYLIYCLVVLILFTLVIVLPDMIFHQSPRPEPRGFPPRNEFISFRHMNSVFLFLVIILISGGMRIVHKWKQTEQRNKLIEAEQLQTQLSFLRSQINPHFLFNTLNSIYSLALIKSDMTAEAVMKLSEMMRYVIDDVHRDKVELRMEIQYIKHFVELQNIRLSNNVEVRLSLEGDFCSNQIPPLILMPFVENAFKFGTSSHEKTCIIITLCVAKDILDFKVSNQVFPGRESEESHGIGIHNAKQRLNLIYPEKYRLEITNNGKVYIVNLHINLT